MLPSTVVFWPTVHTDSFWDFSVDFQRIPWGFNKHHYHGWHQTDDPISFFFLGLMFIDPGPSINSMRVRKDLYGWTALRYAVRADKVKVAQAE